MIRAGTIQEPFESSRELSRRYRNRRSAYARQRAKWEHGHNQHFIFSDTFNSKDDSFHSSHSAIPRKLPFSSPWKYRKLSGDDTVSLINSSMESDDMAWSGMSTNHHRILPEALDFHDSANKQGKMAKIWSLACLLNCPRQKRVPATPSSPNFYQQDRSLPVYDDSAILSFDEEPSRIESFAHFDFEALELQPQIAMFDSNISLFESDVFETSMYSEDLFPESNEHLPNSSNSSQCSVSEIVKEQHEFAQMLEFWRKQAQETVATDGRDERKSEEVMEDKEHLWNQNAGGEIFIGNTHHQRVVVKEFTSSTLPADNTTCCEHVRRHSSLDHTQPPSSMNGDHMNVSTKRSACKEMAEEQLAHDATSGRTAILSECDNDTLEDSVGNEIACEQHVLTSNAMSADKTHQAAENTVACNNPEDDNGQSKENSTELDRNGICKLSRSHIENLIMFWNKSEPKRLGKARGSVSNDGAKDDKKPFSSTNKLQAELLFSLTAGRMRSGHRPGHTSASALHEEDWISRLTVSRTRQSGHMPEAGCLETASTARQVPALTPSSERDTQQKEQLQKELHEEEAIMFWSPRLFDLTNASESSSVSTVQREAYSLSSGKSDSTVSWFGMVGMDAITDDSSIRRRLKNYKAEKDPEDADFEESRQRISPPLMLEEIDNLVTQLSKDYVEAISGLEVTR